MDEFNKQPVQDDSPTSEPVTSPAPVAYEDQETYSTPERAEPAAPLVIQKKKSRAGKWLLWGLVVLLLAGLGAFAYWQFTEAENQKAETASLKNALAVVEDANKSSDTALEAKDAVKTQQSDGDTTTADMNRITAVVTADAQAPVAAKGENVQVVVKEQSTEFATANVGSPEGAGYAVILKKVNDEWVIIFKGQNTPDKTTIDRYGIPADFTN